MKLGYIWVAAALCCTGTLRAQQRARILPEPQAIHYGSGSLAIRGLGIRFTSAPSPEDRFAAQELARVLAEKTGIQVSVLAARTEGSAIVLNRTGPVAPLPMPGEKPGPNSREAYRLAVNPQGIEITGSSSAAIYYGIQTLLQLAQGSGNSATFPEVEIHDWPGLAYRGTLVDVGSEGPMCTLVQIEQQLDFLARWKANQYFLYSEANIELDGYPLLNPQARFTKDQVRQIIAYARERHIDVVPAVEFYGHLHDLFRIEKYSGLADFPHGGELNPSNPKVQALVKDWVSQLAELFPSPFVDIGFDETWSIQKAAEHAGSEATPVQLFVKQLADVTTLFQDRGKHVMAYADIMVKFPDIVSKLPPGIIALPWYYDPSPDPEYKHWLSPLAENHVPMIVLPGVSSWDTVAPNFDRTFANIDTLLAAGRKDHTLGLMNTLWTDDGQMLMQMSWPGMAYGAIAPWQSTPMRRSEFFADYSRLMYPKTAAAEIAQALTELSAGETSLETVFGEDTMGGLWQDPFAPQTLKLLQSHRDDLRQCRLHAESAEEHLYRAQSLGEQPAKISVFMLGAKMLDYVGMKDIYALEIADSWASLPPRPTKAQLDDVLGRGIFNDTHSRTADLMDTISQLRQSYRREWLAQYTDYRLYTALGRWDAEYQYWRRAQSRFKDVYNDFHDGDTLPSLEQMAGDSPTLK